MSSFLFVSFGFVAVFFILFYFHFYSNYVVVAHVRERRSCCFLELTYIVVVQNSLLPVFAGICVACLNSSKHFSSRSSVRLYNSCEVVGCSDVFCCWHSVDRLTFIFFVCCVFVFLFCV